MFWVLLQGIAPLQQLLLLLLPGGVVGCSVQSSAPLTHAHAMAGSRRPANSSRHTCCLLCGRAVHITSPLMMQGANNFLAHRRNTNTRAHTYTHTVLVHHHHLHTDPMPRELSHSCLLAHMMVVCGLSSNVHTTQHSTAHTRRQHPLHAAQR